MKIKKIVGTVVLATVIVFGCADTSIGNSKNNADEQPKGSAATSSGENTSGSRIKKLVAKLSDGGKLPIGLYDTNLGTDCILAQGIDGKQRCFPVMSFSTAKTIGVYVDVNCTVLAAARIRTKPVFAQKEYQVVFSSQGDITAVYEVSFAESVANYTIRNDVCEKSDVFSGKPGQVLIKKLALDDFESVTGYQFE